MDCKSQRDLTLSKDSFSYRPLTCNFSLKLAFSCSRVIIHNWLIPKQSRRPNVLLSKLCIKVFVQWDKWVLAAVAIFVSKYFSKRCYWHGIYTRWFWLIWITRINASNKNACMDYIRSLLLGPVHRSVVLILYCKF